jgi:phosphoglucosamine mutase
VGQAAGLVFQRGDHRHRVVIGKDTRRSGYMIEYAMVAGFTSVGMDVLLLGPMPTPAVAMLTKSMRADLGVMISASHNPFEDNGIKLFGPQGFKLSDDVEKQIEQLLDEPMERRLSQSASLGRARRIDGVHDRYIEFAKRTLPRDLSLDGLRVVIDCAHGAGYKVVPEALRELGADVVAISVEPDGININKECGSTSPEALANKVRGCARRYRRRARRRCRPRHCGRRARSCGRRGPVARGDRAELEGGRAPGPARHRLHRDVEPRARALPAGT